MLKGFQLLTELHHMSRDYSVSGYKLMTNIGVCFPDFNLT